MKNMGYCADEAIINKTLDKVLKVKQIAAKLL